jgi:hypothetical protein
VRGGHLALDVALQGEEEHAQHPLAELDAVLNDAIALVLVGGGRLLESAAAVEGNESLPQCENGVLVVALEGDWLSSGDAEIAEALLRQGARGH